MTSQNPSDSQNTTGSSDLIVYPPEHIRQIAASILSQADYSRYLHDLQWTTIKTFIQNNFATEVQDNIINFIKPHADRLRSSYDWQIDLASALFDAVNAIDVTEDGIQESFTIGHGRNRVM